jgi:hypothetical protein
VLALLAFALALPVFVFVEAGVVAGVAAGVGVLLALVLFAVLFAGAGPHPPWHPYATTASNKIEESAIAFFILVFDLLSSSKIK